MKTIGVFNLIFHNEKVLLVKRRDIPFWDLPGGRKETAETPIAALIRETIEETGLIVTPQRKVGHFYNATLADKQIIFCSQISGGHWITSGPETKELRFFSPRRLPLNLIPQRKTQIQLALKQLPVQYCAIKEPWWVRMYKQLTH